MVAIIMREAQKCGWPPDHRNKTELWNKPLFTLPHLPLWKALIRMAMAGSFAAYVFAFNANLLLSQNTSCLNTVQLKDSLPVSALWPFQWQALWALPLRSHYLKVRVAEVIREDVCPRRNFNRHWQKTTYSSFRTPWSLKSEGKPSNVTVCLFH